MEWLLRGTVSLGAHNNPATIVAAQTTTKADSYQHELQLCLREGFSSWSNLWINVKKCGISSCDFRHPVAVPCPILTSQSPAACSPPSPHLKPRNTSAATAGSNIPLQVFVHPWPIVHLSEGVLSLSNSQMSPNFGVVSLGEKKGQQ